MNCKHFGSCGSCGLYNESYLEQISSKTSYVKGLLKPYFNGPIDIFESNQSGYRARAEFRIWHDGDRCDYAMGNIEKNGAITIDECPKVIDAISSRMWKILDKINSSKDVLKRKLFAIEFLATTTNECLVTMLYHRKLDDEWSLEAKELESDFNCYVMGRSRKQKVVLSKEFVTEKLNIDGKEVSYVQYEGGFTQPNPKVNVSMIEWAIKRSKDVGYGDFLEAYCGLGNFTIPISKYFNKVLATEISKNSINSANLNCKLNNVENIKFVRLSSEEMTEALMKTREFTRLKDINLDEYNFSTVLVDPPRAGLDSGTINLISNIENIIYISCNPETLARDLEVLTKTHQVLNAAMYDQFPHTSHIESGVFLKKK